MESKYTATIYSNNQVANYLTGNDIKPLITALLLALGDSISGSYGIITDNHLGIIIQRYRKSEVD